MVQNFTFLIVSFVVSFRIWTCNPTIGGRKRVLHFIRITRNTSDTSSILCHCRASHDSCHRISTFSIPSTRSSLQSIPYTSFTSIYYHSVCAYILLSDSGLDLHCNRANLELFRCLLLLFHISDHRRTGRLYSWRQPGTTPTTTL